MHTGVIGVKGSWDLQALYHYQLYFLSSGGGGNSDNRRNMVPPRLQESAAAAANAQGRGNRGGNASPGGDGSASRPKRYSSQRQRSIPDQPVPPFQQQPNYIDPAMEPGRSFCSTCEEVLSHLVIRFYEQSPWWDSWRKVLSLYTIFTLEYDWEDFYYLKLFNFFDNFKTFVFK